MRIAVFTNSFPVVSETFILRQITGLLDRGHTVEVFAEYAPDPSQPVHAEVEYYHLLERTSYVNVPPLRRGKRLLAFPGAVTRCLKAAPTATIDALNPLAYGRKAVSLTNVFRLRTLLPHLHRLDILHAHFGPVGEQFRFARRACGIPLVVSFHGYDATTYPRLHGSGCYRRLLQQADLVTVNSESTRRRIETLGCPASKIRFLPTGLDPAAFAFRERVLPDDGSVTLLTVARLVPIKGVEYALRAFAQVLRSYPKARYSIIGDGPLRASLVQLSQSLGISHAVTFHGACDGVAVRAAMQSADAFLLTSTTVGGDTEGQGLVIQEAQASGLPVIVTNHGPFPDGIVADRSGIIAPEGDPTGIAAAIIRLIKAGNDWPAMGRVGRDFVEANYDVRVLNARLVALYKEAVQHYRENNA